jgi:hypothetical protein
VIDLDKLEQAAKVAQELRPGQWEQNLPGSPYCVDALVGDEWVGHVAESREEEIAGFIATCSPGVVLALVARVRAAEFHIEVCSQAAYIAKGQCRYCDAEP